MTKHKLYA